ncbi:NUDIX hydrolase [Devosia nitrariae]|uniref:DNA mismatch repair protein MutT n=1 Tax=Devosia nitrariae TaxID=2071872 RepID=A0ABQ5W425_9HYPH|nr:NUDIX hydrolase [Devosia nitrariae]GLQ54604.1 DNA mismatch repair protein MutT [Devosia nitrariae]
MLQIFPIREVDVRLVPGPWPLPETMRHAVAMHWQRLIADNPHLWDGRILGVQAPGTPGGAAVEDGVLRGLAREDAYSAFLTWRDQGFAEIGIRNLFGSALIASSDNALIYGVMGGTTANAGRVYPPGGSLEPRDVTPDGRVDIERSIALELTEETGLETSEAEVEGMVAVFDGPRISIGRVFRFKQSAEELVGRIRADLDQQEHRELADVVAVRSGAEVAAAGSAPPFAEAIADMFQSGWPVVTRG